MAARKTTAAVARKAPAKAVSAGPSTSQTAQPGGNNPGRLLREAAWSRMFGRVESKNPFTR